MADTAVTNVACKLQDEVDLAYTAATADVADTAETFDITPPRDGDFIVMVDNAGAIAGNLTVAFLAGDFWAAGSDFTHTVAQTKVGVFQIESAKFKTAAGIVKVKLTPAAGKKLVTDHAAAITCLTLV